MSRRLLVLTLVLTSATTALADDPRLAAQQLFEDAERTGDDAKFFACGKAYLDVYNRDPAAPDGDELLYNGAVCFQRSKSIGSAISAYELIVRSYPRSRIAPKALLQGANAYLAIAMFDRAADRLESYAAKYAAEKDAVDALENAIMLRGALGDRAKRTADTQLFVKLYAAKMPKQAAEAMLALALATETPTEQVKALREWVKTYGSKVERERLVVAYGRLGDALWRQACPVVPIDGLCVKIVRDKTPSCSGSAIRVETVARTAAARKDSLAAYDLAIKVVEEAALTDPAAVHAAAMARIARADDAFERMIEKRFPTALDFDLDPAHEAARKRSLKRFEDWLAEETRAGEAVSRAYEEVLQRKDPQSSIAASARLGQVTARFADALTGGEIPASVRGGALAKDKTSAYCAQMTEVAEPLRQRATEALALCVYQATQLGVLDDWVGVCRREGQRLDPKRFPPLEIQPELTLAIPAVVEPPVASGAPELAAALGTFAANEQAGWTAKACRQSADAFAAIAKKSRSADAHYMAGLSFHRCGLVDDARRAYDEALKLAPDHAAARSNLGELAWRAGQRDVATQAWEEALRKNGKLHAAHLDLAIAGLDKLRALPRTDPGRKRVAEDADFQTRSALAVAGDPVSYVVLAVLAADDPSKLDLARAYIEQAILVDDHDGLAHAAHAVLAARRGDWTLAARAAERAATVAPGLEPALRVAGLVGVRVGQLDSARTRLAGLKAQPYEVVLARAIAARGLGDPHGAEVLYQQAIQLEPSRAEAHYDLGVFYELHAQPPAPARAIDEYRRAAALDASLDAAQRADALAGKP